MYGLRVCGILVFAFVSQRVLRGESKNNRGSARLSAGRGNRAASKHRWTRIAKKTPPFCSDFVLYIHTCMKQNALCTCYRAYATYPSKIKTLPQRPRNRAPWSNKQGLPGWSCPRTTRERKGLLGVWVTKPNTPSPTYTLHSYPGVTDPAPFPPCLYYLCYRQHMPNLFFYQRRRLGRMTVDAFEALEPRHQLATLAFAILLHHHSVLVPPPRS